MRITAHLVFDGQCAAAFRFYERVLGGKIVTMLTWADSPIAAQAPAGSSDKILHASLTVGDDELAGADAPPGQYSRPQGFFVILNLRDPAEAERIFHALAEGGAVHMPIQQTFWALRFGVLTDRFGTPWEINCELATRETAS